MQKIILSLLILSASISLSNAFADSANPGFTEPMTLSSPDGNSTIPQLLVSGNNVYVGWIDNAAGKFGAKFAKSNDGGYTFGKEVNLGTIGGAPDNIRISQFQGTVGAVWQSYSANVSSIAFTKSSDNGTTFDSPIMINSNSKDSAFPQIAMYGDHVYVAWLERTGNDTTNLIFAKSDDGGITFSSPLSITNHSGTSGIPKIYAYDNNVYLMWEDNGVKNFDVFLRTSRDSGNTFDPSVDLSSNTGNSGAPQMSVNGNSIYATWMDDSSGNFEILFAKSTDGGRTFGAPIDLSNSKQDSGYPQIAIRDGNVYAVWTETVSDKNYDIYFAKSSNGGKTFDRPIDISNSPGASGWPQIVGDDNNVYVSWVDNTSGKFDIYIAKSTDDGDSFEAPVDIDENSLGSWYNQMAVSSHNVYLAWLEANNQRSDIMFAKSTTFVPEFGPVALLVLGISVTAIVLVSKRSVITRKNLS